MKLIEAFLRKQKNVLPILDKVRIKNGILCASNLTHEIRIPSNNPDGIYTLKAGMLFATHDNILDFPDKFKDLGTKHCTVNFDKGTIDKLKWLNSISANEFLRPVMNGVYFQPKDGRLQLTSSNAHILASIPTGLNFDAPSGFVVNLHEIISFLTTAAKFTFYSNCLEISASDYDITMEYVGATYPKYEEVFIEYENTKRIFVTAKTMQSVNARMSGVGGWGGLCFFKGKSCFVKFDDLKIKAFDCFEVTNKPENLTRMLIMPAMVEDSDLGFNFRLLKKLSNGKDFVLEFDPNQQDRAINVYLL